MIDNDIVYYAHIFSALMPKIKKKFNTRKEAFDFITDYFDKFFPWEKAVKRWGWNKVGEKIENSFALTRVDRLITDDKCLTEGSFPIDIDLEEFFSKSEEGDEEELEEIPV